MPVNVTCRLASRLLYLVVGPFASVLEPPAMIPSSPLPISVSLPIAKLYCYWFVHPPLERWKHWPRPNCTTYASLAFSFWSWF